MTNCVPSEFEPVQRELANLGAKVLLSGVENFVCTKSFGIREIGG